MTVPSRISSSISTEPLSFAGEYFDGVPLVRTIHPFIATNAARSNEYRPCRFGVIIRPPTRRQVLIELKKVPQPGVVSAFDGLRGHVVSSGFHSRRDAQHG